MFPEAFTPPMAQGPWYGKLDVMVEGGTYI